MTTPAEPLEKISPLERYQLFRSRIEHEDSLTTQRLSWLMASQSFLFTAYAIVTNGLIVSAAPGSGNFVNDLRTLSRIIPIVALLNSLLILISILAALKGIRELRNQYSRHPVLETISLQTHPSTRMLGMSAPVFLPLLFIVVWLYLLMR